MLIDLESIRRNYLEFGKSGVDEALRLLVVDNTTIFSIT